MELQMTYEDFIALGEKLYGKDKGKWKFKCVQCGNIQCGDDFRAIGVDPDTVVFFSCIGRWVKDKGCDWTLGGLFLIHKREIVKDGKSVPVFLFADE